LEPRKSLSSEQRIRRQTAFKQIVEKGRFFRGEFFYLWAGCRADIGQTIPKAKPMIGIVVSRKTEPRAVDRNIWKRQVREIFREKQAMLFPESVYLVKARTVPKRPSYAAAEQDLVRLFKKTGAFA
jgi:ribonuclease P protein component